MDTITNYELVVSIIPKGKASRLIEIVKEVGAEGCTVFNARGSGVHEEKKMFGMSIEPEKEVMLTIVPETIREDVVAAVREKGELDEAGAGIGFVVDIQELFGMSHEMSKHHDGE